ncbi:MAG: hypothetical protein GF398_01695 [Chitinivibrionales bacterium]|nr:hypothetical protein [Chitinivibrionales bacterium]
MPFICAVIVWISWLLLAISCTSWPTRIERIDYDRPRVVDFVYKNLSASDTAICEAAPGDTMLLEAWFSGDEIWSLEWEISWDVFVGIYGDDTARNIIALQTIEEYSIQDTTRFTDATQGRALKFVIPPDIMLTNQSVSRELLELTGFSKNELIGIIEQIRSVDPATLAADTQFQAIVPLLDKFGPLAMSALTVPVRVFVTLNGNYKTRSDFSVRYNRHFTWVPGVYVNRNPEVHFIGICKVKNPPPGDFRVGDMDENDTTFCLYLRGAADPARMGSNITFRDTILIDKGYSYFMACDTGFFSGVDMRDTAVRVSFDSTTNEPILETAQEDWRSRWFIQHPEITIDTGYYEDFAKLNNTGNFYDQLFPPLDGNITGMRIWMQLFDTFFGERLRPYGSELAETMVYFEYTRQYLEARDDLFSP